jgi:hypothetical protein
LCLTHESFAASGYASVFLFEVAVGDVAWNFS